MALGLSCVFLREGERERKSAKIMDGISSFYVFASNNFTPICPPGSLFLAVYKCDIMLIS